MEIIIIGGCPGEDLSEYVLKNINFGEYNTKKMKDNHEHTKHDESLYVTTFSEKILNAVRIAISESKKEIPAECHQLFNHGEISISTIDEGGSLSHWQSGVWDAWDDALARLL